MSSLIASAFAVWAALGTVIAGAIFLLGTIFIALWWRGAIHRIVIDGSFLQVNDARIEARHIATIRPLDEEAWRQRRGVDFDPALFHAHRFWMKSGVEITLDDPRDPHRGWLIGSKNPDRLVLAIESIRKSSARESD